MTNLKVAVIGAGQRRANVYGVINIHQSQRTLVQGTAL